MLFEFDQAQRSFQSEVREWLRRHAPVSGPCFGFDGYLGERREWERKLFEAGLAAIHWPEEYGGRGLDGFYRVIFDEEYEAAGAPERLNVVGLYTAGPSIIEFGTDKQRARWLPPILRCDEIWAQGFSEPEAGSDLSAVATTAAIDDETIIVDGYKVWTTLGTEADWLLTLARTTPNVGENAKTDGLSLLGVPLTADGVEVRAIRQLTGKSEFAEVFLDEVRVSHDCLIGSPGEGWKLALEVLKFERGPGVGSPARMFRHLRDLAAIIEASEQDRDPHIVERFGKLYAEADAFRWQHYRLISMIDEGSADPGWMAADKVVWTDLKYEIFELGMEVLRVPSVQSSWSDPCWGAWASGYWDSRAEKIGAGTTEIQLNAVARRLLTLPRG